MSIWIKEGTVGTYPTPPFTDGSGARLGSLNLIRGEILLSKNGLPLATISGIATAYPDKNGVYFLGLDATDTNTRGHLRVDFKNASALPNWMDFQTVPTQKWAFLFGDGSVPTVGNVSIVGSVGYASIVGSVGHVASMSKPKVDYVGSVGFTGLVGTVGYARVVGSVGHVASMANPYVSGGVIGSVGYTSIVGSVGHVASMANPVVSSVLAVGSVGFVSGGVIGTVGHVTGGYIGSVGIVGTAGFTRGGVIGSLGYVSDGMVGTLAFARGGVIGSVGFVSGGVIGSVGRVANVSAIDAGIIGTISHCVSVGTLTGLATAAMQDIADTLLKRDIDQVEATAAVHSLTTAILKAVARIKDNAGSLEIYRTDGATLHAAQAITTDPNNEPIDELGGAA